MENKIRSAFDGLTMPEECANRIKDKLCKPISKDGYCAEPVPPTQGGWLKGIAVAAAMLAVITVTVNFLRSLPQPDAAAETTLGTEAVEDPTEQSIDDAGEENSKFDQYYTVDADGRVYCRYDYVAEANAASAPEWIMEENGRLYFVGNAEKIDITDEISMEEPFTYFYTDSDQVSWCLAVGRTTDGPFVSIGHSAGWFSFHYLEGAGWIPNGGCPWSNLTDSEYDWYVSLVEMLDPVHS